MEIRISLKLIHKFVNCIIRKIRVTLNQYGGYYGYVQQNLKLNIFHLIDTKEKSIKYSKQLAKRITYKIPCNSFLL